MRVNLKKMRLVLGKVLILLTIALTLANAQCFARCLVAPCDLATSPCHSNGNQKSGHCSFRHAITGASARHLDLSVTDFAVIEQLRCPLIPSEIARVAIPLDSSPSILPVASASPLRI